jgi:hypothetical protein
MASEPNRAGGELQGVGLFHHAHAECASRLLDEKGGVLVKREVLDRIKKLHSETKVSA